MTNQTCGNCRHARGFEMTKHKPPRFAKDTIGECSWNLPVFPLPISITGAYGYRDKFRRMAIAPDYTNCPCWEEKA